MPLHNIPDLSQGRRITSRKVVNSDGFLVFVQNSENVIIPGKIDSIVDKNLYFKINNSIQVPYKVNSEVHIQLNDNDSSLVGKFLWQREDTISVRFEDNGILQSFLDGAKNGQHMFGDEILTDRRKKHSAFIKKERRFGEITDRYNQKNLTGTKRHRMIFCRNRLPSPSGDHISDLRKNFEIFLNRKFKHIHVYSESPEDFMGKIENPIGIAHVPLGIAGPLKVNGNFASGYFYIPLATTEGALVTSYNLGSNIITRSGGANVSITKSELRIGPIFVMKNLLHARALTEWLEVNFEKIKMIAEQTSKHLVLKKLDWIIDGRKVNVNFHYSTGDAMGMNMACRATEEACQNIIKCIKPEEFWLRSNFNSNKKVSAQNLINGYGKTVTADVTVPRKLVGLLNTTPEQMQRYVYRTLISDIHANMMGANGHFANAMAALFIACGQDVASIVNSHLGISTCEVTSSGDLYFSVYLSSLMLGTVGGGTEFGTGKECLEMIGCSGTDKSSKFAEIVAATALAGEISICASIVNGTYVGAHERFGRNRPKENHIDSSEQT